MRRRDNQEQKSQFNKKALKIDLTGKFQFQVCSSNIDVIPPDLLEDTMVGDAYGLSIEEARKIIMSDQVCGNVWLTSTYNAQSFSFITIPISQELSDQLTLQRPRIL
jgi:hypothetical protein